MFDIGFSEIVVIGVVALVVIGPERLPRTARTLGHLFGRLQRYVNEVKADINREMELEELRRLRQEVQSAATDLQQSVTKMATEVESGVRSVEQQLNDTAREAAATAPGTAPGASAATASGTATSASAAAELPAPAGSVPVGGPDGAATPPSSGAVPPAAAAAASEPADAVPAIDPQRQGSLPGFDRI